VDAFLVLALFGFSVALVAELCLTFIQPERDWYAGRALAESTKTLAWRYAVRGEPFTDEISNGELHKMLRSRVSQVADKGGDQVVIRTDQPVVTDAMKQLRAANFAIRRAAYVAGRTDSQRKWYAEKAIYNARRAAQWRVGMIAGEIAAIVLATLRLTGTVSVDLAGILAAAIASSAAWVGLKQHSQLASAYRLTTRELAIQHDALMDTQEDDWGRAVADAEEAISREHTMWLASRGTKPSI
jgi:hypothetical protein